MRLRPKDDVSAVVLTLGESTADEAIHCLAVQTRPLREVIVVKDTKPFHRALNQGARLVQTPFFVQVDADMLLDPPCVARLRRGMRRDTGIVVAQLRDALIGRVVGVKLFRRACFSGAEFRDSVSPDTDFGAEIAAAGWKTVYVGKPRKLGAGAWKTYGEHRPSYTPEYTFRKYVLEGRRYRYRNSLGGIRWHFSRLEASRHPSAVVAQVALAHGIFSDGERDMLGRERGDEFELIERFLSGADRDGRPETRGPSRTFEPARLALGGSATPRALDAPPRELFHRFYEIGVDLLLAGSVAAFMGYLAALGATRRDDAAWISKIGICHGLCAGVAPDARNRIDEEWLLLQEFLATPAPEQAAQVDGPRRFSRVIRGVRRSLVG